MTPTDKFFDFIKPLCRAIEGVAYVENSDGDRMDRFSADTVGEVVYPGVFLMRPKYRMHDNFAGHLTASFDTVFYVLAYVEQEDAEVYALVDAAFSEAEQIALRVLAAIRHHDLPIDFDSNTVGLEPVMSVTLDNARGYEVRFKIVLPINDSAC